MPKIRKIIIGILVFLLSLSCFSAFACNRGEAEVYSITYDVAGGTLPVGAVSEYITSDKDIPLPTPTKAGHTFTGWENGDEIITVIAAGTTGNLDLTATWQAKKFTVTINNATSQSFTDWADDSQDNVFYVDYGNKLTIPKIKWDDFDETQKSGNYYFRGWFYKDKDNVTRQFDSDVEFTLSNLNVNTYNFTIYAKVQRRFGPSV